MHDYSTAEPQRDFDIIPGGTLAFAILNIKPGGPPDHPDCWETASQTEGSDAHYLNCDLTVCEGPFTKRKIFTRIGVRGSEGYINMGRSSIRSILEVGRGASAANLAAYKINAYGDLNGLKVAIEVKVEKGTGSYKDKNDAVFLTPNTESGTSKKFLKLLAAAQAGYPKETSTVASTVATGTPVWAASASERPPATNTQAPPATAKPTWLS